MSYRQSLIAALLACLFTSLACAQLLDATAPEVQGVESAGVQAFVEAFEQEVDAPHGVVILRHGHLIAEGWWAPYQPNAPHILYSLSKSFTSTAIGMLADEGKLDIDDPVVSFFPDKLPENPSDNLKAMRIRDLLSMTAGHHQDTLSRVTQSGSDDWVGAFLSLDVEHRPGTHFRYNTGATYMCSAIVQKLTGQTVLEYLTPRLFEPLGIEGATWESCPRGINTGGWGLSIGTRDIAKFGQMLLQHGQWNGKQLISANWVKLATAAQTPNGDNPESDWNQGYGFQFWRSRHNGYRGDGAFGQFCLVLPDQDVVIAINGGYGNMQQVLNLVWKHLLPAIHDQGLPANSGAAAALAQKMKQLAHAPVAGEATSPLAAKLNGKTFTFDENKLDLLSVTFNFDGDTPSANFLTKHDKQRYQFAHDRWISQIIHYEKLGIPAASTTADQPVAASGAWAKPDQLVLRAWLTATPFRLDMQLDFTDDADAMDLQIRMHPLRGKPVTIHASVK